MEFIDSPPCSCSTCQSMCKRPCWPTPSEVLKLIEAGHAHKLMLDYWVGNFGPEKYSFDTMVVCPANPGKESISIADGGIFSFFDFFGDSGGICSGCVFQVEGLCSLHDAHLKPAEGRVAHCQVKNTDLHEQVARTWDTDEGRAVVIKWCEIVGLENPYDNQLIYEAS